MSHIGILRFRRFSLCLPLLLLLFAAMCLSGCLPKEVRTKADQCASFYLGEQKKIAAFANKVHSQLLSGRTEG